MTSPGTTEAEIYLTRCIRGWQSHRLDESRITTRPSEALNDLTGYNRGWQWHIQVHLRCIMTSTGTTKADNYLPGTTEAETDLGMLAGTEWESLYFTRNNTSWKWFHPACTCTSTLYVSTHEQSIEAKIYIFRGQLHLKHTYIWGWKVIIRHEQWERPPQEH